jgi:tetratricopeptide (TPR) repeat protein/DNA-binding winged helix-turn-helix (wHTH) protein
MNRQDQRLYRLDGIEIDTSRFCLTRDGEERHLRQQTFQVLVYLLEQRERLVTKDELIDHVWRDTAVTDNALEQCLAEIRKVLGDDSRNPRFIKTVPRAGYRFIGNVEEVGAETQGTPGASHIENGSQPVVAEASRTEVWIRKRAVFISVAIVLIVAAVTTIYLIQRRRSIRSLSNVTLPQTPGKRAVAVMFFDNQSGSADLDWLREGLADMLITDLSRSKNLTILSRQQLHTLLDRAGHQLTEKIRLEEALDIAQKSKAAILIMGSFARLGEQIRIDAQLHDVRDGQLLAAERLVVDQPAQILTQVDVLAIKLASHLGAADQTANSGLSSVMTNDLAAYRYYSLGVEKAQAVQNPEAIALLEKAIALDPDFAMAYARIGYTYVVSWGRLEEGKPYLEKAFKLTERLSEKDELNITAWYALANQDYAAAIRSYQEIVARYPLEVEGYHRLGRLLGGENRLDEAIEILKQGLVIDPEAKDLYNGLGGVYSNLGRHDEAIAMRQHYVKLAPEEPNAHDSLGLGYQWAGRYDEAIQEYERALTLKPDFEVSVIHLANTLYQQGRYREALHEFQHYIEIAPSIPERARGYSGIAQIQRSKGRLDEAERAARQALANEKSIMGPMLVTALERDDLAAAEKLKSALEKIRRTARGARGDLRELPYYQGVFELRRGRGTEAIEKFKEALQHLAPAWNVDAYEDCLANAYLELGRLDEAIAEYERILKLNPNYPLVHYHLARAYERKGQRDQARAEYQQFLQVWKDADSDVPEVVNAKKVLGS